LRRLSTRRRGLRALHRDTIRRLQTVEREYRRLHSLFCLRLISLMCVKIAKLVKAREARSYIGRANGKPRGITHSTIPKGKTLRARVKRNEHEHGGTTKRGDVTRTNGSNEVSQLSRRRNTS